MSTALSSPELISRFKKERFLQDFSEDDFRDRIVRPLFLRQGLNDGRDLCGPTEKGKDAVFVHEDKLGMEDWYVVQTKRGALNLSSKASASLVNAVTQLRTALETPIPLIAKRKKVYPSKVFLCASGKINESAREHVVQELKDTRLVFLDSDELIPRIDEVMPEIWLGIDSDILPYLRSVKELVENPADDRLLADLVPDTSVQDAATDAMFVPLRVYRSTLKPTKIKGQIEAIPDFEDITITSVLNRRERLILIIGDPGSGKSTSIKRLAYVLAVRGTETAKNHQVPVLLRAVDIWRDRARTLVEICADATMSLVKSSSKATFTDEDLANGRLVILIDALDEISDDAARGEVIQRVREFNVTYGRCQIIITSRDYSYIKSMELIADFAQFRMFPIDYRQAEQIIRRFEKNKSLPAQKSKEILRRLQEVHGMDLNPLLVTVFAATSDYARQDIPANITELFKKYTEWMLGRWNAEKALGQQYHAPLKDFLLRKIAFEIHRRQETSVGLQEFLFVLEKELKTRGHEADIEQLSDEILHRSGLFRVFGDRVEFRHHLLQEFFAGRGIPNVGFLESVISEEWWQRAIVFYFGDRPGDSDAFYAVMAASASRTLLEQYLSALTTGLALQACYLMPTSDKINILPWVIGNISNAKNLLLKIVDPKKRRPLTRFMGYYLVGRDSVACRVLTEHSVEIEERVLEDVEGVEERDCRVFWLIIGMLECGALEQARERIATFRPQDPRLLLSIYLGCFLIQHHRIVDSEERKIARDICTTLNDVVQVLRRQVLSEFKSELLEFRKGEIEAIDIPTTAEEETSLLEFDEDEILLQADTMAAEGFKLLDEIEANA